MKYFYTENYKTLLKEIKEDLNKWKDNLRSRVRRLNIVKMAILSKLNRFSVILLKISAAFICRN